MFGRRATDRYSSATGDTEFASTRYAAVIESGTARLAIAAGRSRRSKPEFLVFREGDCMRPWGHYGKANPRPRTVHSGLVRLEHVTDVRRCQWVDEKTDLLLIEIHCNEFLSRSGKSKTGSYVCVIAAPNKVLNKVDKVLQALIDAAPQVKTYLPVPPPLFVSGDKHTLHLAALAYAVPFPHASSAHGGRATTIFECRRHERPTAKKAATAKKADWPRGKAPRAGFIANSHEFEKFMAKWMQWLGWNDASVMPIGPDGGVDVTAKGVKGQAKYWDHPVGIEEVQRHNGVCEGIPKHGRVFLAKNGYTKQALQWAETHDLPLFEMKVGSKDAEVVASTKMAQKLLKVGAKAL